MKIDIEELIEQEEALDAASREADDRYLECLRARVFPTPSPFGVDWERQRMIEAHNLLARWSQGRKKKWIPPAGIQGGDTADLPGSARQHFTADRQSGVFQLA